MGVSMEGGGADWRLGQCWARRCSQATTQPTDCRPLARAAWRQHEAAKRQRAGCACHAPQPQQHSREASPSQLI